MSTKLKHKVVILILCASIFIVVLGVLGSDVVRSVHAQEVVDSSELMTRISDLVGPDEVLHFETVVFHRSDSRITEPLDPYHLPILSFYKDERVIEHWITRKGFVETTTLRLHPSIVLQKLIKTPESVSIYDAFSGLVTVSEGGMASSPAVDSPATHSQRKSWIDHTRQSKWGTVAWVVKYEPLSSSPEEFKVQSQKLLPDSQGPFAGDLDFNQVQWTLEIDQETGMLVSQTLDALTPSGAITLYSEVRSYPEILSLSNAPSGWNELPNEAQELIVSTAHARSLDISLVNGDPRSPEIIAREFSFPVYLINEVALSAFESKLNKTFVFYQNQRDKFPPPLAFEITQADVYGLGLKVVYLSDNPIDPEHPQALVVVQGPSKDIVSNLKLSLPVWQTSVPISASIAGKETQGWLISEGLLRKSGDNPLIGLMFELEDTFIYLEGQNIPEKELIDVASSLQVVNREQIEQGYSVYLPAVLSGN